MPAAVPRVGIYTYACGPQQYMTGSFPPKKLLGETSIGPEQYRTIVLSMLDEAFSSPALVIFPRAIVILAYFSTAVLSSRRA
jgi:hypothetical protein